MSKEKKLLRNKNFNESINQQKLKWKQQQQKLKM